MRIVIPTHMFLPLHSAGTEIYTYNLARALIDRGHQVSVTCVEHLDRGAPDEVTATEDVYDGIPVHRMSFNLYRSPDFARHLYDNPHVARHLTAYLRRVEADIVHVTSCVRCSASIIPAVKQLGLPLVLTATDYWFLCPRETLSKDTLEPCQGPQPQECFRCLYSPLGRPPITRLLVALPPPLLKRLMLATHGWNRTQYAIQHLGPALDIERRIPFLITTLNMADVVIAPSQFLAGKLRQNGATNVHFQRHGIDTAGLVDVPPKPPGTPLRIGYTGHILPRKGVDVLVRAFLRLPEELAARAELVIHGDVNWKTRYLRAVQRLARSSPRIHFAGRYQRAGLGALLGALDAVVVPSIWYENSPLAILEALATHTPVVTSRFGAMAEFVRHEENGLLFECGNADDMAVQLARLIDEPKLLLRFQAAIEPVKTIEQETSELLALYEQLVRRG